MATGILTFFYLFFPIPIIYVSAKYSLFKKIGPIILCYLLGIIIGNIGILPENIYSLQDNISSVSVLLAIPLMLFSIDIKKWSKLLGKTIISLFAIIISVTVATFVGHLFLQGKIAEDWKLAGLLIGVYTGGTPNLAALKIALNVNPSTYLAVHTSDIIISSLYLLFVLTVAKPIFSKILPGFPYKKFPGDISDQSENSQGEINSTHFHKHDLLPLLKILGVDFLILAIGMILNFMIKSSISTLIVILTVTSLAIGASFLKPVRSVKKSYQFGQYFILIFSLTVGSMADISKLISTTPIILIYVTIAVFGSLLLHLLLSFLFKIDVDTMLVTSVSAICSPPFVGMTADSLKNRQVIFSGITTGLIGYAIGNYLGVLLAYLYKVF